MSDWFHFNPYSSLLLVGCVPALVHAVLLAARARREERWADGLAAVLLVVGVLYAAQWMLGFAGWYDGRDWRSTVMFYVEWSHLAALGPLVWLYLRAVTNTDFRWRRRYAWHFAPALAFLVLPTGLLLYDVVVHAGLLGRPFEGFGGTRGPAMEFKHTRLAGADTVEDVFVRLQLPVYLYLAVRAYRRYRGYVAREFANAREYDLRGLRALLYILVAGVALAFGSEALAYARGIDSYADVWGRYFAIAALAFAAGIQFYALDPRRTRALRFATEPAAAPATPPSAQPPPPGTPPPSDDARWVERLETRLAEHRDYLEPDLKLAELAGRIGTNASVLSRVVNARYGVNFNDLLNGRRCEAFLARVRAGEHERHTLLSLALDSGFNSKSTFNRAFRKRYGYPPGEAAARLARGGRAGDGRGPDDDVGRPEP